MLYDLNDKNTSQLLEYVTDIAVLKFLLTFREENGNLKLSDK